MTKWDAVNVVIHGQIVFNQYMQAESNTKKNSIKEIFVTFRFDQQWNIYTQIKDV